MVSRLGTPIKSDPDAQTREITNESPTNDASHLLTWRKGNVLGKGAYGTVSISISHWLRDSVIVLSSNMC